MIMTVHFGNTRPFQYRNSPGPPPYPDRMSGYDGEYDTVEDRMRRVLPHYGQPDLAPVQFADLYADLAATAAARAQELGALLAEEYRRCGLGALVGDRMAATPHGEPVVIGEEVRALAALEAAERDRAERLAREGIKLGIEAKKVDVMRGYARTIAAVAQQFAVELGLNWNDPATRRAAQRAVLAARQQLGADFASPDKAGPRLSEQEQRRIRALPGAPPDLDSPDEVG